MTIDRLWQKHSEGKFGFSVQYKYFRQISSEFYPCEIGYENWRSFCGQIGWNKNGAWMRSENLGIAEDAFLENLNEGFFPAWGTWGLGWRFASAFGSCLMLKIFNCYRSSS
jgi:hypothetical protein